MARGEACLRRSAAVLVASVITSVAHAQEPARGASALGRSAQSAPAKGTAAPALVKEALWDGRKIAPFRALDDPPMVKASEADFLADGDYILGITLNGESRAYPTRFIWFHHAINDRIGKPEAGGQVPVAVTYCSVCNTGICYDRRLDGHVRQLEFFGLYNGVVALCDRQTESAFPQVDGLFVTGPLLGKSLKPLPLLDTTWSEWKKRHPETLVMSPETEYRKYYRPKGQPEPRGYERFPAPYFRPTVTRGDRRLEPFDKILGVTLPGEGEPLHRAYPIKALQQAGGVINEMLATTPVVALLDPETTTACAFSRKLDDRQITFESRKQTDGHTAFFDKETGTRWSIEGLGEEGTLAGRSLERLENHLSQWYGWVAFFPATTIFGRDDPPQPGNPFESESKPLPAPPAPGTDSHP
jgi:hypothetical protein